jgi:hypothetical protein
MEQQQAPSLVKIAIKYGLIQGVLSFIVFLVQALTNLQPTWIATIVNIAVWVVLMVLAHREFKKTHGGMMAYSQGLGSGTLLSAVAGVLTCIPTFIYVSYINTGYLPAMMQAQQIALEQRGLSGAQAHQAMSIMGNVLTPVGLTISTVIGDVIMGFIVALIVSIFTQAADPKAVY